LGYNSTIINIATGKSPRFHLTNVRQAEFYLNSVLYPKIKLAMPIIIITIITTIIFNIFTPEQIQIRIHNNLRTFQQVTDDPNFVLSLDNKRKLPKYNVNNTRLTELEVFETGK
jgi:hypothetical protein